MDIDIFCNFNIVRKFIWKAHFLQFEVIGNKFDFFPVFNESKTYHGNRDIIKFGIDCSEGNVNGCSKDSVAIPIERFYNNNRMLTREAEVNLRLDKQQLSDSKAPKMKIQLMEIASSVQ